jgi:hypothetical protein
MPSYDLDSLVYLAHQVVEGEIVHGQVKWDDPPSDVKLTSVLNGTLKVGDRIMVPNDA